MLLDKIASDAELYKLEHVCTSLVKNMSSLFKDVDLVCLLQTNF